MSFAASKGEVDASENEEIYDFEVEELNEFEVRQIRSNNAYVRDIVDSSYLWLLQPKEAERAFGKEHRKNRFSSFF